MLTAIVDVKYATEIEFEFVRGEVRVEHIFKMGKVVRVKSFVPLNDRRN